MSKRGASSELNDRNWDVEEEPEEAGHFTKASSDVIQSRVIKRAKRRGTQDEGGDSKPAVFGSFGGLSTKPSLSKSATTTSATGSGFSFGLGATNPSFGGAKGPAFGAASSLNGGEDKKPPQGSGDSENSSSYFHALKTLNESVLAWIKQHVEENPYIFLTPIFKDYQTHLDVIEAKRSSRSPPSNVGTFGSKLTTDNNSNASPVKAASSPSGQGKADSTDADKPEDSKATVKPFSFGTSVSQTETKPTSFGGFSSNGGVKFSTTSSSTSGFTFGSMTKTESTPATFGGSSGFSFGGTSSSGGSTLFGATSSASTSSATGQGTTAEKDEEEYEPPKPEVREIKEDDALYSKRCKLYYQRDGQWVDRGVGNIHLKPVADNKTQLLVRADTNLGNILLNIMLSSSMPFSRQGKNNVFLACVPNPPLSSKPDEQNPDTPVPMLIRVKTAEDADELKSKMDERVKLLS